MNGEYVIVNKKEECDVYNIIKVPSTNEMYAP